MLNLDYDQSRFSRKKGDYFTGPAGALSDPTLHAKTLEYKRRLSGQMRPISGEDIFRIARTSGYHGTRKYDGEFALLAFNGWELISINPGGTVRGGLPCFEEAASLLSKAKVKSCLLGAEIYSTEKAEQRHRIYQVVKLLRSPASETDLKKLGLAVFDILELDGKPVPSVGDVYKHLEKWFAKGKLVHPAEHRVLKDLNAVKDLFEEWVVNEDSEGLVVRHDQAGWYKVKQRHNLDAAIIGFSEGSDDRKGLLHDLLVGVMRNDGTYHEFARVGGGFTDDDRRTLVDDLRRRVAGSDYVAVNNDYVAYEMTAPGPVVEISCLDLISETTKGDPINKMVLDWDGKAYGALSRMPLASVISPQFVRVRDDKEANVEDVNIRQISELVEVAETEKSAHEETAQPSEVIDRVVYTKVMKGQKMVRKLLLWKTNKNSGEFPGYVVYLTDFSPNRQNPLERDIRVSQTEKSARQLFARFAEENFVGGWEKVSR